MTVSRAFALAFAAVAMLVLIAQSLVLLHAERVDEAQRRRAAHELLGHTLAHAVETHLADAVAGSPQRQLDDATPLQSQITVRWVWLDVEQPEAPSAPFVQRDRIRREGFSASTVAFGSGEAFISYTPARVGAQTGAVELTEPLPAHGLARPGLAQTLLLNTAMILVLFGLTGWLLGSRLVGRPVAALSEMARRVGEGDLAARVALDTRTEIDGLGGAMNAMASSLEEQTRERDQAVEQARHADRLATVGKLAAGVAHELGTPLNVVQGRARMLQTGELGASEAERTASEIIGETDRMAGLVRQLLDFAGKRSGGRTRLDLGDVVRHTLRLLEQTALKRGIAFVPSLQGVWVNADPGQLQQVVTNLVVNAIMASPPGGRVEITVEPFERDARIVVRDHGDGLTSGVLEHLFEPFFTTRPPGEGTGLGLAVSYGIIKELQGNLSAANAEGGGARFEVRLPSVPAEPS